MKNGLAKISKNQIGISDSRIKIEHGASYLNSFLIASFGTGRIYSKLLRRIKVNYKYFIQYNDNNK